jgi:protein-disulfide isomerase
MPAAIQAQAPQSITKQSQDSITSRPGVPTAGARNANITIVEFLDYNCPFCKKTAPELKKLLGGDRQVRILYKEWPIFGEVSTYAARSVLAANWQGRFLAAHDALISTPDDLDDISQVNSALKSASVDLKQLALDRVRHSAEIDAALARSAAEAKSLGLRGTPGFLIGRELVSRALTLQQLQQLVDLARSEP